MPSLNLITTTAGRAAIVGALASSSTITVADVRLSNVNQSVGLSTTTLSSVVATLTATGSVRAAGSGYALHVVVKDDSTATYDVRALALRLTGGTFLMVYSQAALIATKAADSSLHLALDLTIDADTAATISFGDTDYALPAAGESSAGVLELATASEVDSGADVTRALTPSMSDRRVKFWLGRFAVLNRSVRTAASSFAGQFRGITYGNGLFVAVGSSGEIQTSPDGITWTKRTQASSYSGTFRGVTYAGGLFVAVGTSGAIQTSPDGTTWTSRTAASSFSGTFYGVGYFAAAGLYVAVGSSGTIQTSPNGTTWTSRTAGSGYASNFRGVTEGDDGLAVIVGDTDGEIQTSPDGITWTKRATGLVGEGFQAVAFGDGVYLAVGTGGTRAYSTNATSWTVVEVGSSIGGAAGVAYGNGVFAAASSNGHLWMVSPSGNGIETLQRATVTDDFNGVAYGRESFVFVGTNGRIEQSLYL